MPIFYFHLRNDFDVPDDEPKEFPDVEVAMASAVTQARELAGQIVKEQGRISLSHRIDIEDENHAVVATVALRDVVRIEA